MDTHHPDPTTDPQVERHRSLLWEIDRKLSVAAPFTVTAPKRARQLELLFVDDQRFVKQTVTALLSDRHLNLRFAETALEAVDCYTAMTPHMVFLDINMPEVNGFELLELLARHDPQAHVIMLTGEATLERVHFAKAHGAKGYVAKPFNRQQLMDCVERYVEGFEE